MNNLTNFIPVCFTVGDFLFSNWWWILIVVGVYLSYNNRGSRGSSSGNGGSI